MVVVGMSIFVFLAVAQALGAGVMGIAQVFGDGDGAPGFHFLQGTVDRGVGAVALVGGSEINRGLGNGDARLGPTDEFRSLMGGGTEHQCHGIGQTNVFCGADH